MTCERYSVGRVIRVLALLAVWFLFAASSLVAQVQVRGYYRSDGTYVRPHVRTYPDGNPYNNYSFPGNYNPNTGRVTPGNPATYLRNYYDRPGRASRFAERSVEIGALQMSLRSLGYNAGPADGIFGRRTSSALRAFQGSTGIPATGSPDAVTLDSLIAALQRLPAGRLASSLDEVENAQIPANASLNFLGNGWECDRGYVRSGSSCRQVRVPANASLDFLGNGWECNRGYVRSGSSCRQVRVPANASLNFLGNGWECNRGYVRSGSSCRQVRVPANASLDFFGHGWECNRGYVRSGNRCVKERQY